MIAKQTTHMLRSILYTLSIFRLRRIFRYHDPVTNHCTVHDRVDGLIIRGKYTIENRVQKADKAHKARQKAKSRQSAEAYSKFPTRGSSSRNADLFLS